jgi:hypothetical protein
MKFLIKILVIIIYFSRINCFSSEIFCDSKILKEISLINKDFFHLKKREFLQISSNGKLTRKKTGFFEYESGKFVKINYNKPKSEIFYDNSDYVIHTNIMLKSVKKYKNQNPLFSLILNSDFDKIFESKKISCAKCLMTQKSEDQIIFKANLKNFSNNGDVFYDSRNLKSYDVIFYFDYKRKLVKQIDLIFSKDNFVNLIFKN